MHPLLQRLILKIEIENSFDAKNAVMLLAAVISTFLVLSNMLLNAGYVNVSNSFMLAAIVYGFPLVLVCKESVELWTRVMSKRWSAFTRIVRDVVLTVVVLVLGIMLLDTMYMVSISNAKLLTFSVALVLLVGPTFFWDRLFEAFGMTVTRRLFPVLLLFIVLGGAAAQNNTFSNIGSALEDIQSGLGILSTISGYINSMLEYMGAIKGFFSDLGLNSMQTNAILIVAGLTFFYFVLKFLKTVVKWAIVFIIAWIGLQIVGVI